MRDRGARERPTSTHELATSASERATEDRSSSCSFVTTHDRSGFMETLEASHACRLCGNKSGISINIFDKKKNHIRKINAVLPIMVHEMDLLPKLMCHLCSFKLEEFYKFYLNCLKTDAHLKSQLSWMKKKEESKERIGIPMVQIKNVKIKVEPIDYEMYDLDPIVKNVNYIDSMKSRTFPMNRSSRICGIREKMSYKTYCQCWCDKKNQRERSISNEYKKSCATKKSTNDETNVETRTVPDDSLEIIRNDILPSPYSKRISINNLSERKNEMIGTNISRDNDKIYRNRRIKGEVLKNPLTCILRPRKISVNYVETRKKLHSTFKVHNGAKSSDDIRRTMSSLAEATTSITPTIKIEKEEEIEVVNEEENEDTKEQGEKEEKKEKEEEEEEEDEEEEEEEMKKITNFEGRALRPRKGTINYNERKRKTFDNLYRPLSHNINLVNGKKQKLENVTREWRLANEKTKQKTKFMEKNVKVKIKEEIIDDLENMIVDNSEKNKTRKSVKNSSLNIDDISQKIVPKTTESKFIPTTSHLRESRDSLHLSNKLESLPKVLSKSNKIVAKCKKSLPMVSQSLKYLRSHNFYLRSGKIKKFADVDILPETTRHNAKQVNSRNSLKIKKDLSNIDDTSFSSTNVPSSVNLKHYCERCNISFANKELYKLHTCYG
ncbi:bromodomain-containing protein DDB_G0280777-like isoform X1 [Vespa mandarinia]|uniref:bromodomain-containing protein DDB_G0280777-like isoform X1 n=2 Tax=Vespa mandarinia TaxID=7446 RepID=UPI0016121F3B|nr:bromodomain-containing protein DDB_G0280777-like isoform X1 [Vespa mandarinia]XP_035720142.1 bromodomain-containing protein DDB_G0280777-like isoform X1 [Vespa mandarinia]